jgi:hypothetical protein
MDVGKPQDSPPPQLDNPSEKTPPREGAEHEGVGAAIARECARWLLALVCVVVLVFVGICATVQFALLNPAPYRAVAADPEVSQSVRSEVSIRLTAIALYTGVPEDLLAAHLTDAVIDGLVAGSIAEIPALLSGAEPTYTTGWDAAALRADVLAYGETYAAELGEELSAQTRLELEQTCDEIEGFVAASTRVVDVAALSQNRSFAGVFGFLHNAPWLLLAACLVAAASLWGLCYLAGRAERLYWLVGVAFSAALILAMPVVIIQVTGLATLAFGSLHFKLLLQTLLASSQLVLIVASVLLVIIGGTCIVFGRRGVHCTPEVQ